ncbi:restriction endonuclease subunit S [Bifidobacterium bifidum]|uniref:restriction endonuclease subunit S n=1 Tax=Bifidobacterium bifidum TaxID=1681 RepID=UPI0001E6BF07|nr:HsdS-like protein of Type I restriction-modification system [Bifidobacterium bifidum S17]
MTEQAKVPSIRFAGFTDPWEQRKLGEIASFSKGSGYSKADIRESGIPLFLYGRMYTQYETRVDSVDTFAAPRPGTLYSKGTEIVVPASGESAEDIARASAITREGIALGGDLNVVYPQRMVTPLFLAYGLSHGSSQKLLAQKAQGKTVVHIHASDLKGLGIAFPDVTEQQAIGTFFSSLDDLITLHQRKYDKLVIFKKTMLEKMFPKDGESVPEIRFAGFTDPWEQRKLGEFSKKNTIKNANGALSETFTNSAEQGVISQLDYFDHDITNDANISGYYVVQPDDFVYNPRISATAPCGPINRNRLNRAGVMSPLYTVFSVDASMDKTYLEHYFKTSRWHDFMFLEGNTGARSDRFSISDATLFEMPIWCPEISEQIAMAKQLETTETLITLHQRKLELLRNIKKSLLDKMFV